MSKSLEHLQNAFAGESQANRKYTAFAKKADEDGYPQVARLFRAAAQGETVHALAHLAAMDGIKSTEENLKEALGGENYEVDSMYPVMIQDAKAEENKAAARSFRRAFEVEKIHSALYKAALDTLSEPQSEVYAYWVCPVCGYVEARNAPETCPVCGTLGSAFICVQ
jgi:rubrerythrin